MSSEPAPVTSARALRIPARILAFALLGATLALSSCSMSGPIGVSTDDVTICGPAKIGEKFVVGEIITMPAGAAPVVKSIEFREATGVRVVGQAAFVTKDVGGFYTYPLAKAERDFADAWAGRSDLPTDGPIDMIDQLDGQGEPQQRAEVAAIVERTGDAAGYLRSAEITYEVGGFTYRATGTITYWLNNGPCDSEDPAYPDTDAGRADEADG